MPYMYIIECDNGTYYTGSTVDLDRRMVQHWTGEGANYTRKHKPLRFVYAEEFQRIDDAFYREKQVQNWSHTKKKALIEKHYETLHNSAVCINESKADPSFRGTDIPLGSARGTSGSARGTSDSARGKEPVKKGIPMNKIEIENISTRVNKYIERLTIGIMQSSNVLASQVETSPSSE